MHVLRNVSLALMLAGPLLVGGCASGSSSSNPPADLSGSGNTICPNNPSLCSGTCCSTSCVDTANDPKNCGACGTVCPPQSYCVAGACKCGSDPVCSGGTSCCGTACKDLKSDAQNCGTCGNSCNGGTCTNGTCSGGGTGDMATSNSDGGSGNCACTKSCLIACMAGCCFEDILLNSCTPDPACVTAGFDL